MRPLNILVLEDDDERILLFHKTFSTIPMCRGAHYSYTKTRDEFYRALNGERFDVAFLDHDLGDNVDFNGTLATKAIIATPEFLRPRYIVIHSMNHIAAEEMHAKFNDVGIVSELVPFSELIPKLQDMLK